MYVYCFSLLGFHKAWYNIMCKTFVDCNQPLMEKLNNAAKSAETINMETEFCSVSLDIIGKSVFNYDFGSVTKVCNYIICNKCCFICYLVYVYKYISMYICC